MLHRLVVSTKFIEMPDSSPLEGVPEDLRMYWQERLGLTLDADGRVEPFVDRSATLSAAQPKNYQ